MWRLLLDQEDAYVSQRTLLSIVCVDNLQYIYGNWSTKRAWWCFDIYVYRIEVSILIEVPAHV